MPDLALMAHEPVEQLNWLLDSPKTAMMTECGRSAPLWQVMHGLLAACTWAGKPGFAHWLGLAFQFTSCQTEGVGTISKATFSAGHFVDGSGHMTILHCVLIGQSLADRGEPTTSRIDREAKLGHRLERVSCELGDLHVRVDPYRLDLFL